MKKRQVNIWFILSKERKLLGEPEIISFDINEYVGCSAKEIIKQSAPFLPFPDSSREEKEIFKGMPDFRVMWYYFRLYVKHYDRKIFSYNSF